MSPDAPHRFQRASLMIQHALDISHYDISAALQIVKQAHDAGVDIWICSRLTQQALMIPPRAYVASSSRASADGVTAASLTISTRRFAAFGSGANA